MKLPEVTDNIATSRDATRLLERCLPGSWPSSTPKEGDDYGIDIEVSISEDANDIGRRAHIQVKGTRQTGDKARTFRMKASTLNYLRAQADIALIARIQVEEPTYWLINIHDGRTHAPPADDGYVNLTVTPDDEVAPEDIARVIDVLSYRQRLSDFGDVVQIVTVPPEAAVVLHRLLDGRLPRSLSFISTDNGRGSVQALLELPNGLEGMAVISDRGTPYKIQIQAKTPATFLLDTAVFLAFSGVGRVAADIVMSSVDLLTEANIGTLTVREDHVLHDACSKHSSAAEICRFVQSALPSGERWAGQWAVNFALKDRLELNTRLVADIVRCWPRTFSGDLLHLRLLLMAREPDAAKTFLKTITPPERDRAEYLFEYGILCELLEEYDTARAAWFRAARNGYDRISCHIEVARSFLVSGRVSDAIRFTPRQGMAKDQRAQSVLVLLRYIRLILSSTSREHREAFDAAMDNNDTIVEMVKQAMVHKQTDQAAMSMVQLALLLVAGFRANEHASAKTWASALVFGIRARVYHQVIDAIVALSSVTHGGQALRLAASLLGPKEAAVLERWHLIVEQNRGVPFVRRTEDFVSRK